MKIGWIGLGKLGLVCAMTGEQYGSHEVLGYDPSELVTEILATKKLPYQEEGAEEMLRHTKIRNVSVSEVVRHSDLIFVAVQTPHAPEYEGVTRVPENRVDFDYSFLKTACVSLNEEIEKLGVDKSVVIVSTVMPGTVDTQIKPLLTSRHVKLGYSPLFIAMTTTKQDYLTPEFVVLGVDDEKTADMVVEYYSTIHNSPVYRTTIKNAEFIKLAYNFFISMKISYANYLMEIADKTGADVDAVTDALKLATTRVVGPKYLSGGMGDSGGCHPRDAIAMSWIAKKLGVSFDWADAVMVAREKQTEYLADLVEMHRGSLDTVLLGYAYKEHCNLTVGSSVLLLKNILAERGVKVEMYDPWVEHVTDRTVNPYHSGTPKLFFVGTRHREFLDYKFPRGSVVIDPWRMIKDQPGVRVIRVGENKK
jgi:UDPglucose 6-dehydrogenase